MKSSFTRLLPALSVLLVLVLAAYLRPWSDEPVSVSTDTAVTRSLPSATTPSQKTATTHESPSVPPASVAPAEPAAPDEQPATDLLPARGWVRDPSGTGLEGVKIDIESSGVEGEEIVVLSGVTDASGEFVIPGLIPGRDYSLEVVASNEFSRHSIESFTVAADSSPRVIVLERLSLVNVDGMIVDTDRAPVPDFELNVRSLAAAFPDRTIRSDATGFFRLEAFPAGELQIATNASDYYRIKGLALRPNEYQNIELMIDRGNYHLSGWVTDDNGSPVFEAQVTLKSAFAADGYHSSSYRTTATDENGAFEFDRLGGSRLSLGVYARGFRNRTLQHEFQSFADRVEIRLER